MAGKKNISDRFDNRIDDNVIRKALIGGGLEFSSYDCCKEVPNLVKYNYGIEPSFEEDDFSDLEESIYEKIDLEALSLLEIEGLMNGTYQPLDEETGEKIALTEEDRQECMEYCEKRLFEVYNKAREFNE